MQQVAAKRVWPSLPASHPINEVLEDQAAVEAPLLKDLIELGAEVTWLSLNTVFTQGNDTAAGAHIFYRRATSGASNVSTTSVNIPVTRFKLNYLFGCRPVISEVVPNNAHRSRCRS